MGDLRWSDGPLEGTGCYFWFAPIVFFYGILVALQVNNMNHGLDEEQKNLRIAREKYCKKKFACLL